MVFVVVKEAAFIVVIERGCGRHLARIKAVAVVVRARAIVVVRGKTVVVVLIRAIGSRRGS